MELTVTKSTVSFTGTTAVATAVESQLLGPRSIILKWMRLVYRNALDVRTESTSRGVPVESARSRAF